ncbi:hypothetical protein [Ruegeria sp. Alg231-54]|uniref:hypothetical protein n=1 Tax=Ruegeria sp. Alg231-54 TaxID=1922221 RepID=UPI000D5536E1|nr:hypothetical protein [Ruegeria sp. Alg231-54]
MTDFSNEFFGQPEQQDLQRRADRIWTLVKNDPTYSCHGRAVGLSAENDIDLVKQIAMTRLQGVCMAEGTPVEAADRRREGLEQHGLKTDQFVDWQGSAASLEAAAMVLASRKLPDDLELMHVDAQTPGDDLAKLDTLTQACGVLLPMGAFIRRLRRPSVCLLARDRNGKVVAATAAVAQFHPDHRNADQAWWGMLATDESRRGEGIALIMGANSMLAIRDLHGLGTFFTGIREGNAPSEGLCRKLEMAPTNDVHLMAIDPGVFAAGRLTK